ncbi:glycosyl transferase [Ruegeria sp. ANG-S4]|nr:glycosyl transferase [Ruegeria sp. ANG-S4]
MRPDFLALVNQPTHAGLTQSILEHWQDGRGFTLATLNLDHIVKMRQNPVFLGSYMAQSHVVADGNPIVWLSRLAGRRIELIPGSELVMPLAALATEHDIPVALLGATEETLQLAADSLRKDYPKLQIVAQIAPPFGFDPTGANADTYLETLRRANAKLCFLALGAPKQEIFASRGISQVPECGFVSIGAGLDFIAGQQTRAPQWVRKLALEWVWRMLGNPRRLALRYTRCISIMPGLIWQAIKDRAHS